MIRTLRGAPVGIQHLFAEIIVDAVQMVTLITGKVNPLWQRLRLRLRVRLLPAMRLTTFALVLGLLVLLMPLFPSVLLVLLSLLAVFILVVLMLMLALVWPRRRPTSKVGGSVLVLVVEFVFGFEFLLMRTMTAIPVVILAKLIMVLVIQVMVVVPLLALLPMLVVLLVVTVPATAATSIFITIPPLPCFLRPLLVLMQTLLDDCANE